MSKTCIPKVELTRRGLEEFQARDLSGGSCAEGLDAQDEAILLDEHSGVAYNSESGAFQSFASFFEAEAPSQNQLYFQTIAGVDLYTIRRGQILGFPKAAKTSRTKTEATYTMASLDGLLTKQTLTADSDVPGVVHVEIKWEKENGTLVRKSESLLNSFDPSATTWYLGDGTEYLQVTDSRQQLSVDFLSPLSPPSLWDATDASVNNVFAFEQPVQRHLFYRFIDRFTAGHDIRLDFENKAVHIDGKTFQFHTAGSSSVTPEELHSKMMSLIPTIPLYPTLSENSINIFLGNPVELLQMARSQHFSKGCIERVEEVFQESGVLGTVCLEPTSKPVFVHSVPKLGIIDRKTRQISQTLLPHELGHIFTLSPGFFERFRIFFIRYVAHAFEQAEITEGADRDLLMILATNKKDDTWSDLSESEKSRFKYLWQKYDLSRFFPSQHALSNENEFFASLVEAYNPWHRFQQHLTVYYPFFEALEILAQEGEAACLKFLRV
ncbi:MAG: hypothetical protein Q7S68_04935 [Deltaproteobacteria bacterium]|nr:hypothetical protein [Deltaproteobacteria bacterium]